MRIGLCCVAALLAGCGQGHGSQSNQNADRGGSRADAVASSRGAVTAVMPKEGISVSTDTSSIDQLYPEQAKPVDHSWESTRQDHVQTALERCSMYKSGDTFTFNLCLKSYGITPDDVAWAAERPPLSPSERY